MVVCYLALFLRVAFADEQVDIFNQMRRQAREGTVQDALGALDYTVNYYPSGTKQIAGSRLDRIVESARRSTISDIITELRRMTGEEYGEDPEAWLREVRKDQSAE